MTRVLVVGVMSFLAGYGLASLGIEIASQREALRLRDTLTELDADEVERRTRPLEPLTPREHASLSLFLGGAAASLPPRDAGRTVTSSSAPWWERIDPDEAGA